MILMRRLMEAKKLSKKALDTAIRDAYNQYFEGVQIDIMDLGKIRKAMEVAIADDNLSDVMLDLVRKHRKN